MKHNIIYKIALLTAVSLMASVSVASADFKVDYLYNLSNFDGIEPYSGATMFVDETWGELYVCHSDGVSIFSPTGMEVYSFGDDGQLGSIGGGAVVDKDGDIMLLAYHNQGMGRFATDLLLFNYRGEPISRVTLKGIPPEFGGFSPSELVCHNNKLYLADLGSMKVVVADQTGKYLDGYNIASIMRLSAKSVADSGMTGFNADDEGNIYYTISVYFQAYKMTPDRKISSWGTPGSAPGKFNVVTGIATDKAGNIYVVDTLKAAVLVFDKKFHFMTQFGGRGWGPGDLIAPRAVVIDGNGMVYVSQSADRGVNVYKITQ